MLCADYYKDTANVYSNGESERIIAKAIKQVRRAIFDYETPLLIADFSSTFRVTDLLSLLSVLVWYMKTSEYGLTSTLSSKISATT